MIADARSQQLKTKAVLYVASFGYTRDDVGNPLSFEDQTGTWGYGYDSMNRLTSATPPEGAIPANAGGPYNYDWVGNRLNPPANPNPMIYNAADQLTLWPGMHWYLYDDNGALTHVKTADGSVVQQSFTYHPTGLMNTATFQGGTMANIWDADEHRVKFTTGGQDYKFIFDLTAGIPAILAENTPAGTVYYIREPGGELIAMSHPSLGLHYYHFDELGSTRLITDDSGAVTDRFTYDAYGAVPSHNRYAGSIDQPYQYVGRLGYYTHYMQPEFGWLQLGVRLYEPELGRFERRGSPYLYASKRPTLAVQPTGKEAQVVLPPWTDPDPKRGKTYPGGKLVSRVKICNRPLGDGSKECRDCLKHAFILMDGEPIGYGPATGADRIVSDTRSLYTGAASCTVLDISDKQYRCLRKFQRSPQSVPGNWKRGVLGNPWDEGRFWIGGFPGANCWSYAHAALGACDITYGILAGQ